MMNPTNGKPEGSGAEAAPTYIPLSEKIERLKKAMAKTADLEVGTKDFETPSDWVEAYFNLVFEVGQRATRIRIMSKQFEVDKMANPKMITTNYQTQLKREISSEVKRLQEIFEAFGV